MKKQWWLAALVVALDQWTKLMTRQMTAPVELVPGVLGLRWCENTGMAFSLLDSMPWLMGILSLVGIGAGFALLRSYRLGVWSRTAAMLMLGGALGNLIDRLLRHSVTDMIEILAFPFAVFNVADMALTIGCGLMMLSLLCRPEEWESRKDAEKKNRE